MERRLRLPVTLFRSLQDPTFLVDHAVVRPAKQRQVGQRRLAAAGPPDQVMSVAPTQWSCAARKDAVPVACFQRPPRRRRQRPAGVIELVLELALAGDSRDGAVAGVALHRLRRYRAATLELARRRAFDPGERVEAGADDQLRPGAGAVTLAAGAPVPGEFDQCVNAALAVIARVVFDRLHERLQGRPQRGTAFGIE